MSALYTIKSQTTCLIWALVTLLSYQGYAQSGSFGNTFIFSGSEIAIHNVPHNFQNGATGTQPGIVGTERTAPQGYLSFVGTASHSGAANNAHVDGYVKTYMTTPFTFPIGDNGKYRPAAVSTAAPGAPADAAYYGISGSSALTGSLKGGNEPVLPAGGPFSTTSTGAGVSGVDNVEYWDINGATAVRITLTFDANSAVSALTGSDLTRLTIVGWNGTQWVATPSTVDATALSGGSSTLSDGSITTSAAVVPNTYSVYTLGAVTRVVAGPDSGTANTGTGGTAVANVLTNDVVNGQPATLGAAGNATVATVGTYPTGITLNPATGSVSVAVGTVPVATPLPTSFATGSPYPPVPPPRLP